MLLSLCRVLERAGRRRLLVFIFVLCAAPVTLMCALVTPPTQSPDEGAHMTRIAGLLRGEIVPFRVNGTDCFTGQFRKNITTGAWVDKGLVTLAFGITSTVNNRTEVTHNNLLAMLNAPPDHSTMFGGMPNTAVYFPLAYLPAVAGAGLSNVIGARPYVCLIIGRVCMAIAFLALGSFALSLAAFGESLILTVLLFPMTLYLAGSVNQDGILIALTCLACAFLTRGSRRDRLCGLVAFVCVLGAKFPYIPLLAVFCEPLFAAGWLIRIREAAIAAIPVIVWVCIVAAFVAVHALIPPYHPGPLYAGDPHILLDQTNSSANFHILIADPTRFLTVPWKAMVTYGSDHLLEMIGTLGLLTVWLPSYMYWLGGGALAAAIAGLFFTGERRAGSPGERIVDGLFTLIMIALSYWLLNIALYLSWTHVGSNTIEGFQGRYLTPLVPFLIFAVPKLPRLPKIEPIVSALPAAAMGVFNIVVVPLAIISYYYPSMAPDMLSKLVFPFELLRDFIVT